MKPLAVLLLLVGVGSASGAEDVLENRQDLKDSTRVSFKASKARSPESGKGKAGAAFGDKERREARGGRVGRRIDPGFQVTAPGSGPSTGKPLGVDGGDAPEIGVKDNVTPYQADLDQAKKAIETNSYRLVEGARDSRDPTTPGTGRLAGASTLVIGLIIAVVGGLIGRLWGQTLQGSLITAVGAFIGATAFSMILGAKPDPERLEADIQAAGMTHRARIRENFAKAGDRVIELAPSEKEREE